MIQRRHYVLYAELLLEVGEEQEKGRERQRDVCGYRCVCDIARICMCALVCDISCVNMDSVNVCAQVHI